MYPVSNEFLEKILATQRQIFGLITINYTDPFLDESVLATSDDKSRASYPSQVANGRISPNYKYASFDGTWKLGNGFHLSPEEGTITLYEKGWWSETWSDGSGNFSSPHPTLTLEFFSRPIREYRVVGDDKRGEYPVDFDINNYDIEGNLLETISVTGNDLMTWTYVPEAEVVDVTKQTLVIKKWSHPNTNAKIVEFFSSVIETYLVDDIIEITLLEELESSSSGVGIGAISSNELSITLKNEDRVFDLENEESRLYNLVRANRRIEAFLGQKLDSNDLELVPLGTFWSGNWDVPERDVVAKTTGRDRLDLFRQSQFPGTKLQTDVSFYDLFEEVLQDAGLNVEQYEIDTDLNSIIIPYGYLPRSTHREALRTLAEASLSEVFCSRDDKIIVNKRSDTTYTITNDAYVNDDFDLIMSSTYGTINFRIEDGDIILYFDTGTGVGRDDYFNKTTPTKWDDIANFIEIETQPLTVGTSNETVYELDSEAIDNGEEIELTCVYNVNPCGVPNIVITGNATLVDYEYYAWGAIVNIVGTLDGGSFGLAIDAPVYRIANKQKIFASDTSSIRNNGQKTFQIENNTLIQTRSQAKALTEGILELYKNPRVELKSQWRGNLAWEIGDVIGVADMYSAELYQIIRQELIYSGGLKATIEGR